MNVPEMVALAASLGACASAIAGFFTVREIARQRQAAYRPEIVPSSIYFVGVSNSLAASDVPYKWVEHQPGEQSVVAAEIQISLLNIGMGAARDVELTWNFDLAGAVDAANRVAQESLSATFFKLDNQSVHMNSAGGSSVAIWSNERQKRIDYVLPASASAPPERVAVPFAYRQLISAIVQFSFKSDNVSLLAKLPELNLDVSYVDIAGTSHKARYVLSSSVVMGAKEFFHGQLQSSRRA